MMKVLRFFQRHKILIVLLIVLFLILVIVAYIAYVRFSPYVAISFPSNIGEACGSIVYDKKEMNSVDRIVIQTSPDKEFEITDQVLIKKL